MKNKKTGAILITSLWILAILSILAVGIGFRVSVEARLARYDADRMKALYLARAGAVKAEYRLMKSPAVVTTIYECGTVFSAEEASDQEKKSVIFKDSLGEGSFRVFYILGGAAYPGMSDEERRININTAPENVLKNLLVYIGEDPTIASGIAGWRSQGPGLDDGYYEALPSPYKCKHEKFSAPEELLLVKGIDRKVFDKVKNYITIFGDPAKFTVNINTAPKEVLSVLLMASASIDKITADYYSDRIIDFRGGPDKIQGTRDDNSFNSDISVELIIHELSAAQVAELKNSFTTTSGYFRIESEGIVNKTKVNKKAVYIVRKEQGKAPTLKYYREY